MKSISKSGASGFQKVLWDQVDATFVAGVHLDEDNNSQESGFVPAGTAIKKGATPGVPHEIATGSFDDSDIVGLLQEDTVIEDYTLCNIVQAGTARIDALPANEGAAVADLKKVLPRISFY